MGFGLSTTIIASWRQYSRGFFHPTRNTGCEATHNRGNRPVGLTRDDAWSSTRESNRHEQGQPVPRGATAAGVSQTMRHGDCHNGVAVPHAQPSRCRRSIQRQAAGHLATFPGMHGLLRIAPPLQPSHRLVTHPRPDFAGLPRDADGGLGCTGGAVAARIDGCQSRQVSPRGGRRHPESPKRHLLQDRREDRY